ncbi:MAG TPA: L-histidine N(alpha)-methyltransferase [Candidatus Udaeobacter sp.]|nr:L-histidine N(alpha)-methyltransferase [Candidatus Udaeobacter sp.]
MTTAPAVRTRIEPGDGRLDLEQRVRSGLTRSGQKTLPSQLLYDALGSALFEVIGFLPEYGLTRADERILKSHAVEIARRVPSPLRVVELGSGSGRKTHVMLSALAERGPLRYQPIDVSSAALARCESSVAGIAGVTVEPIESEYLPGLGHAAAGRAHADPRSYVVRGAYPASSANGGTVRLHPPGAIGRETLLVLFLGSTIGNFEREDIPGFLAAIRAVLTPGDLLLVGTDLIKAVPDLLAAYDDPLGVTAAFDLNVLARLNREMGADFDLTAFRHQARWNADARRIEMHLVSEQPQMVNIEALGLEVAFTEGESIWTESSHKFEAEEALELGERAGFQRRGQWLDREWPFAESLFIATA